MINNKVHYANRFLVYPIIGTFILSEIFPLISGGKLPTEGYHIETVSPEYPYYFAVKDDIAGITAHTLTMNYYHFISEGLDNSQLVEISEVNPNQDFHIIGKAKQSDLPHH